MLLVILQQVRSYKMTNIKTITDKDGNEHIIIDHGNEQFTSMPKSEYDRQQAEQSTPILPA
jgi:hypothetical protein